MGKSLAYIIKFFQRFLIGAMEKYDVVVVGSGPAGIGAAFSAAKLGLKTAILERGNFVGGRITAGYNLLIEGLYTEDSATKLVGGIADELIARMQKEGGARTNDDKSISLRQEVARLVLGTMAAELKIDVYLGSLVDGVETEGTEVGSVYFSGKNGWTQVGSKIFIDASGDADMESLIGLGTLASEEEKHHYARLPFRISGVDEAKLADFAAKSPDKLSITKGKDGRVETVQMHEQLALAAQQSCKFQPPTGDRRILYATPVQGEFVCTAPRIAVQNFASGYEKYYSAEIATREAFALHWFLKSSVPGFAGSRIEDTAHELLLGNTRSATCEYMITEADVAASKKFYDGIARCGTPMELHDEKQGVAYKYPESGKGSWFQVPYGAMTVKNIDNLLVAGRCICAEAGAQSSIRNTATSLATGQAAATAAYLSFKFKTKLKKLDPKLLQGTLKEQGCII